MSLTFRDKSAFFVPYSVLVSEFGAMLRLSATHQMSRLAFKLCTLLVVVSLLAAGWGAAPVFSSLVAPGRQMPPEEHETHSDVRIHCPRQVRLRALPDATVARTPVLCAREGFHYCGRQPQPQLLPCFVGSGIRLRC